MRLAVLFLIVVLFILSFFVLRSLLRQVLPDFNTVAVVACFGAIPVSLAVAAVGEKLLKMTWHSGRRVIVQEERIRLEIADESAVEVARDQGINQVWWYFEMGAYPRGGRERRIPGSWYCAAGQLQQDRADSESVARIVIYSYLPPKKLNALIAGYEFFKLDPDDVYDTSMGARFGVPKRPELPAEVIAGKAGKYWLAERNRWRVGVELTPDDFRSFLETTGLAQDK